MPFRYCCIGIQRHANTASLFETAESLGVSTLMADDINEMSFAWQTAFIDRFILNEKNGFYIFSAEFIMQFFVVVSNRIYKS